MDTSGSPAMPTSLTQGMSRSFTNRSKWSAESQMSHTCRPCSSNEAIWKTPPEGGSVSHATFPADVVVLLCCDTRPAHHHHHRHCRHLSRRTTDPRDPH